MASLARTSSISPTTILPNPGPIRSQVRSLTTRRTLALQASTFTTSPRSTTLAAMSRLTSSTRCSSETTRTAQRSSQTRTPRCSSTTLTMVAEVFWAYPMAMAPTSMPTSSTPSSRRCLTTRCSRNLPSTSRPVSPAQCSLI